jgi:hypothetical protein
MKVNLYLQSADGNETYYNYHNKRTDQSTSDFNGPIPATFDIILRPYNMSQRRGCQILDNVNDKNAFPHCFINPKTFTRMNMFICSYVHVHVHFDNSLWP